MSVGKSEEEFEKRLGAALLAGDPLISFDNCERPLGGELLCQCLTQRRVKVRILGKSEQPALPCDATFCATGNNLVLAGDVTRRAIVARLDPKVERPEEREFAETPDRDDQARPRHLCAGRADYPAGLYRRRKTEAGGKAARLLRGVVAAGARRTDLARRARPCRDHGKGSQRGSGPPGLGRGSQPMVCDRRDT